MRDHDYSGVLDWDFINEYASGFHDFEGIVRACALGTLEQRSGISRSNMETVAKVYVASNATIACYGMGLTQHARESRLFKNSTAAI